MSIAMRKLPDWYYRCKNNEQMLRELKKRMEMEGHDNPECYERHLLGSKSCGSNPLIYGKACPCKCHIR